jgi:hypothetical protein
MTDEKLLCPICMHNLEFVAASPEPEKYVTKAELRRIRDLAGEIHLLTVDRGENEPDSRQS